MRINYNADTRTRQVCKTEKLFDYLPAKCIGETYKAPVCEAHGMENYFLRQHYFYNVARDTQTRRNATDCLSFTETKQP